MGSTGWYVSAGCAVASMAGEKKNEATAVAPTMPAHMMMTAVGPMTSAMGPAMMMGTKLARLTRVFRTPKTRPRTSSGSSSWSAVWAGTATKAYEMPAVKATRTLTLRNDSRPLAGQAEALGRAQDEQRHAQRHEADLDEPLAGHVLAEEVEDADAHDQADTQRQHQHPEVGTTSEPERLHRERRTQHAQDADERRGDGQVRQGPEDVVVVPDVDQAVLELGQRRPDRDTDLTHCVARDVAHDRRRGRQGPAQQASDQVQCRPR